MTSQVRIGTSSALAVAAVLLSVGIARADDLSRDTRAKIGFEVAASQHITLDPNVPSQGLGSYLVTISNCNDCHTQPNFAPGGDPTQHQPKQVNLANYLAGGRLFPTPTGNFCSRNLTPATSNGLPAGLTREQFITVIRTGCDPLEGNIHDARTCDLLQVMPWSNFNTTYRNFELSAIYDYLSVLPHTEIGDAEQCTPDPQGLASNQ